MIEESPNYNQGAFREFERFVDLAREEADRLNLDFLSIEVPFLKTTLMPGDAAAWFKEIEPLLLKLVVQRELPSALEDRALCMAMCGEQRLKTKLLFEPYPNPVQIDGTEYDCWVRSTQESAKRYEQCSWALEEDVPFDEARLLPVISEEEMEIIQAKSKEILLRRYSGFKDVYTPPPLKNWTTLLRQARVNESGVVVWAASAKGPKVVVGQPVATFSGSLVSTSCAQQIKLRRQRKPKDRPARYSKNGRRLEEAKVVYEEITPAIKRTAIPAAYCQSMLKWGFFATAEEDPQRAEALQAVQDRLELEPGQITQPRTVVVPPPLDFVTLEQMVDMGRLQKEPAVSRQIYRDQREGTMRAQFAEQALVRRARRQFEAASSKDQRTLLEHIEAMMKPRHWPENPPMLYLQGRWSGNLYPVQFLRYVETEAWTEEVRKKYRPMEWALNYWVIVRVLNGLPWRATKNWNENKFVYINPILHENDKVLCLEDELFTIEGERMQPAELHRFMEIAHDS